MARIILKSQLMTKSKVISGGKIKSKNVELKSFIASKDGRLDKLVSGLNNLHIAKEHSSKKSKFISI